MKKKSTRKVLFNLPKCETGRIRPQLLRIIITNEHTKVDFGYQTMRYYITGGWVQMAKDAFIRIKSTGEKLTMTKAENITIAPERLFFKSRKDWLYFSLYFPPLPNDVKLIDIIEAEPGGNDDFNFLNVHLDTKNAVALL